MSHSPAHQVMLHAHSVEQNLQQQLQFTDTSLTTHGLLKKPGAKMLPSVEMHLVSL